MSSADFTVTPVGIQRWQFKNALVAMFGCKALPPTLWAYTTTFSNSRLCHSVIHNADAAA
jgi:hypothetical protein